MTKNNGWKILLLLQSSILYVAVVLDPHLKPPVFGFHLSYLISAGFD